MNYNEACEILDIIPNSNYIEQDIKRQYRINALKFHPDKNINEDTNIRFHKIQNAYEYLMKYEGYMDNEFQESDNEQESNMKHLSFRTILLSFLNDIMSDDTSTNMIIFYTILKKISSLCEKKAIQYMETFDKPLLIKIYNILYTYQDAFHYTKTFISKIEEIIKNKNEVDECIILNPSLDDIYNDNLYKLVYQKSNYAIPLWHHELIYDNSGNELYVNCLPLLPENTEIDSNNNIIINVQYKIQEVFGIDIIYVICGPNKLPINVETLHLVKNQRITFVNMGISRINTSNIYDTTKKSNVYVDLLLLL
jgi:hypothetical protein